VHYAYDFGLSFTGVLGVWRVDYNARSLDCVWHTVHEDASNAVSVASSFMPFF
jgi:hypothetical protein